MRWIATTLLGLLALAYAIVVFSTPGVEVRPAPDDAGFGGLSLFSAAARDAGYRVAFDGSTRPRLSPDDVAIVPVISGHIIPKAALEYVSKGGRAFVLGVPKDLQPVTDSFEVADVSGRAAKVDETEYAPANPVTPAGSLPPVDGWRDEVSALSTLGALGKGRIARLDAGALATNRFLGRLDNAKVVLSVLRSVAKPGSQLVFLPGGYGEDAAPGPIEAIGPGAVGALWQSLAVLAAFGVARGIRFGLSAPDLRQRRGARELLDAVAGHYRRARRTDAPLAAAARERPDDEQAQALAARIKVPEADARRALIELETRPKARRRD
jgi:hypothetical protein